MGQFDDLIDKYTRAGADNPSATGEEDSAGSQYEDLVNKYLPGEEKKAKSGFGQVAGQLADLADQAGSYVPSPLKALAQAGGALTGLAGKALVPNIYDRAYKKNLEAIAPGREASPFEKIRAAPDWGNLVAEGTPEPESNWGKAAKTAATLGLSIGTDPATYLTAGLSGAGKLAKFAATGEKAAEIGKDVTRLGAAGKAATKVLGSPIMGAIYGPEIVSGGLRAAQQGNTPQAMLMGGLAALMGKGLVDEATAFRVAKQAGITPPEADIHATPEPDFSRAAEGGIQEAPFPEEAPPSLDESTEVLYEPIGEAPEAPRVAEAVPVAPPKGRPAVWRSKDSDLPVTIIGEAQAGPDGRQYVPIAESGTWIPVDELQEGPGVAREAQGGAETQAEPQVTPEPSKASESPVEPREATSEAPVREPGNPQSEVERLIGLDDKALVVEIENSSTQRLRDLARELAPEKMDSIKKKSARDLRPLLAKLLRDKKAIAAGDKAQAEIDARNTARAEAGLEPEGAENVPTGEIISGEEGLQEARNIDPNLGHVLDLDPARLEEAARGRERAAVREPETAREALDSRANLPDLQEIGNRVLPSDLEAARLQTQGRVMAKEKKIAAFDRSIGRGTGGDVANRVGKAAEKNELRRLASQGLSPEDISEGMGVERKPGKLPRGQATEADLARWQEQGFTDAEGNFREPVEVGKASEPSTAEGPPLEMGSNQPNPFREQGTGPSVAEQARLAADEAAYREKGRQLTSRGPIKPIPNDEFGGRVLPEPYPNVTREGDQISEAGFKAKATREKVERKMLDRLTKPMDAGDLSKASLNQEFVGRTSKDIIEDRLINNHLVGDEGKKLASSRKKLLDNLENKSGNIFEGEPVRPGWRPWRMAVQDGYFSRDIPRHKVFQDFPGIWQAIKNFRELKGIKEGPPNFLGEGAFNAVYDIGGDTVARVSTSPVSPLPKQPWMLPFHKTEVTPEGWRVDFAPKAKTVDANNLTREFVAQYRQLAESIKKSGYDAEDLRPDNVGYHNGKLVVIDPGAVRPKNSFQDPHYFDYITRQDIHYEGAARETRKAIEVVEKLPQIKPLKIISPEESPLRPVWAKLEKGISTLKEKGLKIMASTIAKDIKERGFVSLEGQQIDPKNHVRDIATLGQLLRNPFEIAHVIAWDKDGNVLSDRAFSAGHANNVPLAKLPNFRSHLLSLEVSTREGRIAGYADVHNHPGGSPKPSGGDVNHFKQLWEMGVTPANKEGIYTGYHGTVVTDHGRVGYMDYKVGADGYIEEVTPVADRLTDAELGRVGIDPDKDPMFDQSPLGYLYLTKGDNYRRLSDNIAKVAGANWGDDAVRIFHVDNSAGVRAASSVPLQALKNTKWLAEHLDKIGADTSGGYPILYYEPRTAKEYDIFHGAVADLYLGEHILDAVVPSKILGEALGVKVNPSHGTHLSVIEAMGAERSVPKGPAKMTAAVQQEFTADEFLRKPKLPRKVAPLEGKLYEKDISNPKPGGKPDIGPNAEKDIPGYGDLSAESQKKFVSEWRELNKQAARSKPTALDYDKQVRDAMRFLGDKSPEQVLNLYKRGGDIKAAAKRTTLAHMQYMTARDEAFKAAAAFEKSGTEANRLSMIQAQTAERAWGLNFVDRKTEAARMLKALDVMKYDKFDPKLNEMGKWIQALKKRGLPDNVIDGLKDIYTNSPEDFAEALQKALAPSWWDKFLEFRTAGLVFSPLTRLTNIASNQVLRGLRDMENVLSSGIDVVRSKITGTQRERYLGEATTLLQAYKHALSGPEGAVSRWIAEKGGFTLSPISDQFGGTFLDASRANQGAIPGKLGEGIRVPFKGLEVDDAFAKHLAAAQEVYRYAYREAYRNGFRGSELKKIVSTLGSNLLDVARHGPDSPHFKEEYMPLYESIQKKMKDDTFQTPLEGIFASIQHLQQNHPLVRAFLPFVKTPSNVALEGIKRTPLGFLKTWADYKKGVLSGGELSEELAKNTMGTTMAMGLALMAYNGFLTGGGPTDPDKQKLMKQTGWQPYSVKLGKEYYSYQRFEPLASIIGFASDAAEFSKRGEINNAEEAVSKILSSLKENLTNKTFLQGLSDLFTAWSDDRQFFGSYMRDQAGSLVPKIISRAAVALDPTVRKKNTVLDAFKANIPGLSQDLEPLYSGSGEPVERSGSSLERFASPVQRSSEKEAPVERELIRLDKPLRAPSRTIQYDGRNVQLSREEYKRLLDAREVAYKKAARVIKDPTYQALPDNPLDGRYRTGRTTKEDVLDKIFRDYSKLAQAKNRGSIRQRESSLSE